ncbi:hypothetical protein ACSFA8_19870 [Variovorax sp. RT4R15]|uniref:hypothetical protein n=1 Tax=Variovorax sp. RT4R15 TaxID=3443737 RepID=UPI003F461D4A
MILTSMLIKHPLRRSLSDIPRAGSAGAPAGDVAAIASMVDSVRLATSLIMREVSRVEETGGAAAQDDALLMRVRMAIAKVEQESLQDLADAFEPRRPAATRADLEMRALEAIMNGAEWLSAAEIGRKLDPDAANPHAAVSRWLQNKQVFAIDHRGKKMYPGYLFGETWRPIPEVKKVLSILADYSPFRLASWFESTNATLQGKRPRELLKRNAKVVIEAAERHLVGAVHG